MRKNSEKKEESLNQRRASHKSIKKESAQNLLGSQTKSEKSKKYSTLQTSKRHESVLKNKESNKELNAYCEDADIRGSKRIRLSQAK